MAVAQSSHLQEVQYDEYSQNLTVQFTNGEVYQYQGVPISEHGNFRQSGYSGTYFWANIRGRYSFIKLTDPRPRRPR